MPVEPYEKPYRAEGRTSFELFLNGYKNSGPTPTHLVFLIHGIGYKMYEESKFQENIFALSDTTQEVLFSNYSDSKMRIYYLPITWAAELHALTTVDGRMNKITLPTIPGMRVITNDCLSDVLYYFTDFHRQQLLDIICAKMNKAFDDFKSVYPDFNGYTGLISHSLGGVISYDLMTVKNQENFSSEDALYSVAFPRTKYPKLNFEPSFLFTMGAPVGAVMVMRGLRYEHFCLSGDTKFMNIFNPYDPLAYRLEPLISEEYDNLEPVPIPVCELKESSSYLPSFTSLLPERPNIMRAARSMLANLNLVEDNEPEVEENLGEQSDDEFSESDSEVQATNDCIRDLKAVDKDDMTTRRLSGLNATAIGFSKFKSGAVVEKLHELRHSSSNSSLSSNFNKQRPSSLYQSAMSSLYPKITKPQEPKYRYKSKPKSLRSRRYSFPPPLNPSPATLQNSGSGFQKQVVSHIVTKKDSLSGNESDDEASPCIPKIALLPASVEKDHIPIKNEKPAKLSRSKTWANLTSIIPPLEGREEEMMWLWGGIGYGLAKDSGQPISGWGEETPGQLTLTPTPQNSTSETKKDVIDVLDIDESPPIAPEELSVTTLNNTSEHSRPKLISKLTSTSCLHVHYNKSNPQTEAPSSPRTVHEIPVLRRDGSSTSVPIVCSTLENETAQVLEHESKLAGNLESDAIYPPSIKSDEEPENTPKRVDYCIQARVMSNLSFEYIVGLGAHFSYWNNKDVANLILKTLNDMPKLKSDKPNSSESTPRSSNSRHTHRLSKTFKTVKKTNSTISLNSATQFSEASPLNSSHTTTP